MKALVYGIFDWDDNILHMPTLIKAYDTLVEKFMWLTTEQFAKIRNTTHPYTFDDNSFDLFYDYIPTNFETDIERAVALKTFGPSFDKLIRMIKNGQIIAIVTARGHAETTLRNGLIKLVKMVFTKTDVEKWHANLRQYRKLFNLSDVDDETLEKEYWDECFFIGVGAKKDQIGKAIRKVENEKEIAIRAFIDKIYKTTAHHNLPIKIGFSDDDNSNLNKIHELFVSLLNIYPTIKFRLYDTSNRDLKKVVI